jgi:hypothetical protein
MQSMIKTKHGMGADLGDRVTYVKFVPIGSMVAVLALVKVGISTIGRYFATCTRPIRLHYVCARVLAHNQEFRTQAGELVKRSRV